MQTIGGRRQTIRTLVARADAPLIALGLLFAAGAAVRLWALVAQRPAFLGHFDSLTYISAAQNNVLEDPFRPAGYAVFLRVLHDVEPHLTTTIAVQHVLGLITAALIYLTARRLGLSRWVALAPTAVVLLDASQIFLEHAVMSEALFGVLLAGALYASARALDGESLWWPVAAGVLVAGSAIVRVAGLALLAVVALAFLPSGPDRRRGLLQTGAAAAAVSIVFFGYLAWQQNLTGSWSPARSGGAALYARVAPFADCTQFTPPRETAVLCERADNRPRRDPQFYISDAASPAKRAFGVHWHAEEGLSRFTRAVVTNQPLDYAGVVARDFLRFVVPSAWAPEGVNPSARQLHGYLRYSWGERTAAPLVSGYYDTDGYSRSGVGALDAYARFVHVSGPIVGLMLVLAVAGLALASGRRLRVALPLAYAVATLLAPVASLHYEARYGVPAFGALAIAAALGGVATYERVCRTGSPG